MLEIQAGRAVPEEGQYTVFWQGGVPLQLERASENWSPTAERQHEDTRGNRITRIIQQVSLELFTVQLSSQRS